LKKVIVLFSILFLAACSGAPVRPPQENAIFHALTQDVALRQIVNHCGTLSTTLKNRGWQTQQDWWKRNGSFVEAAEFGFSHNLVKLNGDRRAAGSRYAMAVAMDVALEAESISNPVIQSSDRMLSCESILAKYGEGKMDLNTNRDLYKLLLTLDQQKGRYGKDLFVQQAKIDTKTGERYSRSSISAERLVIRKVCRAPKIATLKADWPSEIFEATCSDNKTALVTCEWGNCKVRQ